MLYYFMKVGTKFCAIDLVDFEQWKCLCALHTIYKITNAILSWIMARVKRALNEKKVVKLVARPMSLSTDSISRIADGGNKQAVFIL